MPELWLISEQQVFTNYEPQLVRITKYLRETIGQPRVDFGSGDYFVFPLVFEGQQRELKVYRESLNIGKTPEVIGCYLREHDIGSQLKTGNAGDHSTRINRVENHNPEPP